MTRSARPDYGIDSPAIVAGQFGMAVLALGLAIFVPRLFALRVRPVEIAAAAFFFYGAVSMLSYSRRGKLALRDTLLSMISWRGDERVLDVGCGPGLLLIGAARRLTSGRAVGVDLWLPHAVSGNRPEAVLANARLEGVGDRVTLETADARRLPFASGSIDVVLSNFLLHEVKTAADRESLLGEMARVLKPGGRVALVDFIFTGEGADVLRRLGLMDVRRIRIGGARHWIGAVLMLGTFQLCALTANKPS